MLRRKLLAILGVLVVLLLAVAVSAIFLLQGVLGDLDRVRTQEFATVDKVSRLSGHVGLIQIELFRLQLGSERHLDSLIDSAEQIQSLLEHVAAWPYIHQGRSGEQLERLRAALPSFYSSVSALATSQDETLARAYNQEALSAAVQMNEAILQIAQAVRDHADAEQSRLISRFRWTVLGLGVAFVLLINTSILLLLRAAEMVLRPIDALVRASRSLGEEKYDTRVVLPGNDEFGELAQAYNALAEHLQENELRRLETLRHVALTLNHELNNAMTIIQMQLELLKRSTRGDESQERYLRQIRENLERMAETVESLKHIRRIVLTDYVPGQQMIDLQKSTQPEPMAGGKPPQTT